jgi:thiol-disulfide isomerase/thioredoxin
MKQSLANHWKPLAGAAVTIAVVAALLVGVLAGSDEFPEAELTVEGPLPQLTGVDPVSREAVSTDDFAGRPLMINMWASWCEGCRVEAPDIRRFVADRPDVAFIGLDVNDDDGAARDFVEKYEWTHPSIRDPKGELASELNLQGLPTTVYVWPDGRLAGRSLGEVTYEDLQSVADTLVKGAPEEPEPSSDEL